MKAAMFYGAKDVRIEEVPDLKPGKKQIKVKVKWCGICGTDLHDYLDGPIQVQSGSPHPLTGQMLPLAMGHEFAGVITELGDDVTGDFKIGDKVTCDPCYVCHTCEPCKFGRYNSCESLGFVGLSSMGAFAEYVVIEDYQCYKMPEEMSFEQGSVVEPACVALHAVRRGGISLGETVLVVGLGPIGLLCVQAAKAAGAAHVYGVDNSPKRMQGALDNGCTAVFDFTKCDVPAEVKKANGGRGVHVAIDACGINSTMRTCLDSTRHMGKVVTPGQSGKFETSIISDLNFPERTILGSHVYNYEFDRCIPLVSDDRIRMDSIVTAKIYLDDIVADGFE